MKSSKDETTNEERYISKVSDSEISQVFEYIVILMEN